MFEEESKKSALRLKAQEEDSNAAAVAHARELGEKVQSIENLDKEKIKLKAMEMETQKQNQALEEELEEAGNELVEQLRAVTKGDSRVIELECIIKDFKSGNDPRPTWCLDKVAHQMAEKEIAQKKQRLWRSKASKRRLSRKTQCCTRSLRSSERKVPRVQSTWTPSRRSVRAAGPQRLGTLGSSCAAAASLWPIAARSAKRATGRKEGTRRSANSSSKQWLNSAAQIGSADTCLETSAQENNHLI